MSVVDLNAFTIHRRSYDVTSLLLSREFCYALTHESSMWETAEAEWILSGLCVCVCEVVGVCINTFWVGGRTYFLWKSLSVNLAAYKIAILWASYDHTAPFNDIRFETIVVCSRRLSRGVSIVVTSVALAGISELHSSTVDWLGKYFC